MSHHPKHIKESLCRSKATAGTGICYSYKFYATVQRQFWLLQLVFMSVYGPFCSMKPNSHSHISESISWRNARRLGLSSSLGLTLQTTNLENRLKETWLPNISTSAGLWLMAKHLPLRSLSFQSTDKSSDVSLLLLKKTTASQKLSGC